MGKKVEMSSCVEDLKLTEEEQQSIQAAILSSKSHDYHMTQYSSHMIHRYQVVHNEGCAFGGGGRHLVILDCCQ